MNLKTDYGWNEDDFIQDDEKMKELTVTITLCEYRNLLREQTQNEAIICELEKKLKDTQESYKNALQVMLLKSPETIKKIVDVIETLFPRGKEEGESDEQISQ